MQSLVDTHSDGDRQWVWGLGCGTCRGKLTFCTGDVPSTFYENIQTCRKVCVNPHAPTLRFHGDHAPVALLPVSGDPLSVHESFFFLTHLRASCTLQYSSPQDTLACVSLTELGVCLFLGKIHTPRKGHIVRLPPMSSGKRSHLRDGHPWRSCGHTHTHTHTLSPGTAAIRKGVDLFKDTDLATADEQMESFFQLLYKNSHAGAGLLSRRRPLPATAAPRR